MDIFLDILLKPPQPLMGLFLKVAQQWASHFHYSRNNKHVGESIGEIGLKQKMPIPKNVIGTVLVLK